MSLGTPTNMTNNGTNVAANSFVTASITPTSGDLIFLWIRNAQTSGLVKTEVPQPNGAGLNWKLLYTGPSNGGILATSSNRGSLFMAVADGSATAGTITISFTANQANCAWVIDKITGADLTTLVSWCVQAGTFVSAVTAIPAALPLAVQDVSSVVYAVLLEAGTNPATLTVNNGFTTLVKAGLSGAVMSSIYKVNDNSPSWTLTTAQNSIALTLEITAANAGNTLNPFRSLLPLAMGAS